MKIDSPFIEIKVKNISKYTHLASFLDNPIIIKFIRAMRKKWEITSLYAPEDYMLFLKKANENIKDRSFHTYIRDFRIENSFDPIFERVLKSAIVCNEVCDEDYILADLDIRTFSRNAQQTDFDSQFVIIINPNAKKEDVLQAFNKFRKFIKQPDERNPLYTNLELNRFPKLIKYSTKNEIKRDRKLYMMWLTERQRGKGIFNRIAIKWNSECLHMTSDNHDKKCQHCIFDINKIEKVISNYREFLKKTEI